ncbi:protein suppressor of forked [Rhopalosiphum maidis]|uniref:protein suppressor of forked n=1 Tax=Rhopalosiphum maidis TaxID=43146 RepID=UPI000F00466C|nr:protein suppressor of forked [Rhopalosiphum maidis]
METAVEEYPPVNWGNEKLEEAQDSVNENPWDVESWAILLREAQTRWINDVRSFFEKLVTTFPTSGRYWKYYIEMEMRGRNFEKVEKLFQRCLVKVLNIELWKLYLAYVKETKALLPTYKEKMAQAYDFALEKIGMDIHSHNIWQDYITFLSSVEAVGSYAENQKITAIRKVYQRGVVNPMINIELLWKEYLAFEQSINIMIADKMMIERSRDYMNARRVTKEYEVVIRGLNKNYPSVPPTGSLDEMKQVELWKKYIIWEKANPLNTEDTALITRRVMFAFDQALLCMTHHPDFWYEAAQFLDGSSKILSEKGDISAAKQYSDEAANVYERAIGTVLNTSMLLRFAYADFEEGRMNYEKVHSIYKSYLDNEITTDPTLTYVQYMKFARRAEGIKSARAVFKKAREDPRSKYHVYVSAALMEYYCSKDKNIAFRIFELGLKKYCDNPQYIISYIDYLSHLNEDNNTRVLFERVLSNTSLEPEKSVDIWNRFLEFESNIGDLSSILKVEKRRSAVFGKLVEFEGKETAQLVDRYRFLNLFPCTSPELRSIGYNEVTNTVSKTMHNSTQRSAVIDGLDDLDNRPNEKRLPLPDISQMVPYKPKLNAFPGEHIVPGGTFPPPPPACQLMQVLPPPGCFHGPFVSVDMLMDIFLRLILPDKAPMPKAENGCDVKLFDTAMSVQWANEDTAHGGSNKKKRRIGGLSGKGDDSDEDINLVPPPFDIYRSRQQKRVSK